MSNGAANCLLEVCCPPAAAQKKFAQVLARDTGLSPEYADQCAAWVYTHFDLAERGTLRAFKDSIVKVFQHHE